MHEMSATPEKSCEKKDPRIGRTFIGVACDSNSTNMPLCVGSKMLNAHEGQAALVRQVVEEALERF